MSLIKLNSHQGNRGKGEKPVFFRLKLFSFHFFLPSRPFYMQMSKSEKNISFSGLFFYADTLAKHVFPIFILLNISYQTTYVTHFPYASFLSSTSSSSQKITNNIKRKQSIKQVRSRVLKKVRKIKGRKRLNGIYYVVS